VKIPSIYLLVDFDYLSLKENGEQKAAFAAFALF